MSFAMEVAPMTGLFYQRYRLRTLLLGFGLLAFLGLTGCQIETGGQTLPSPYYMMDDVQYFPPGSQFKLSREAAAMKAYGAEAVPMPPPSAGPPVAPPPPAPGPVPGP
jgi:hypothetical protein